jgi:hypothetical protein
MEASEWQLVDAPLNDRQRDAIALWGVETIPRVAALDHNGLVNIFGTADKIKESPQSYQDVFEREALGIFTARGTGDAQPIWYPSNTAEFGVSIARAGFGGTPSFIEPVFLSQFVQHMGATGSRGAEGALIGAGLESGMTAGNLANTTEKTGGAGGSPEERVNKLGILGILGIPDGRRKLADGTWLISDKAIDESVLPFVQMQVPAGPLFAATCRHLRSKLSPADVNATLDSIMASAFPAGLPEGLRRIGESPPQLFARYKASMRRLGAGAGGAGAGADAGAGAGGGGGGPAFRPRGLLAMGISAPVALAQQQQEHAAAAAAAAARASAVRRYTSATCACDCVSGSADVHCTKDCIDADCNCDMHMCSTFRTFKPTADFSVIGDGDRRRRRASCDDCTTKKAEKAAEKAEKEKEKGGL